MSQLLRSIVAALLFLVGADASNAVELSFASASQARAILSSKDRYISAMSPFDRAARMKTDRDVSQAEFVEFAASAALDWDQPEKDLVETAFGNIRDAVARSSLPLPDKIDVIKTSGSEEGNAAYTRGNAIVLPRIIFGVSQMQLQRLLAHELFHIASRTRPERVDRLYEAIGFQRCGEVEFPASLASRKISNPDAPQNDHCIEVKIDAQDVWAVPILLSSVAKYDTSRGGEFFQYLRLAFLVVERTGNGTAQPVYDSGGPRLVDVKQVSGFFEQVGRNTTYIIHPEEILADNFALLVLGDRNVRSPEVLTRIRSALTGSGASAPMAPDAPATGRP